MGMFTKKDPEPAVVEGHTLRCEICTHDRFFEKEGQLNTPVATFFNLDFVNPSARCLVCANCGYVHWFLPLSKA